MVLVFKFGGISTLPRNLPRVLEIIRSQFERDARLVVVVSAMAGVTDLLQQTAKLASMGSWDPIPQAMNKLRRSHLEALKLIPDPQLRSRLRYGIRSHLSRLESILRGIHSLGELTPSSLDLVSSFGERLICPIFCGLLNSAGIPSKEFDGSQAGIITNSKFGNADPLEQSYELIPQRLNPVLSSGMVPVITGYIAQNLQGKTTTLGRGGSDYSACIIGAALNAEEIWLWKDTDGILSADPSLVPNPIRIPQMSYLEAMELSYWGGRILHPKSLEPAREKSIPVRIKSIYNPDSPGTVISDRASPGIVKSLGLVRDLALINISGSYMVGVPGSAAKLLGALGAADVNIILIAQSSSERNISLGILRSDSERARNALDELGCNYQLREDVAGLAVVGAGMAGTPGVAGRIFSCLGRAGVNIIAIAQSSSEYNISMVISESDSRKAIQALHAEFFESGEFLA